MDNLPRAWGKLSFAWGRLTLKGYEQLKLKNCRYSRYTQILDRHNQREPMYDKFYQDILPKMSLFHCTGPDEQGKTILHLGLFSSFQLFLGLPLGFFHFLPIYYSNYIYYPIYYLKFQIYW